MTTAIETNGNRIATVAKPTSHDDGALANLTDGERFGQLQRVASLMGQSALTPKHLRGATPQETTANCFRVVNQAMRWGFDPFAVGDETYVVQGRLGYQGKLVAAVINARAGLKGRLKATYTGTGDGRTVTIIGQFATEAEARTIDLNIAAARTANQMWKTDPDQKLFYSGVVKWARRHCPELILGVMIDDDLDKIASQEVRKEESKSVDAEILGTAKAEPAKEAKSVVEAEATELYDGDADNPEADMLATDLAGQIDEAATVKDLQAVGTSMTKALAVIGEGRHKVLLARYQERFKVLSAKK